MAYTRISYGVMVLYLTTVDEIDHDSTYCTEIFFADEDSA